MARHTTDAGTGTELVSATPQQDPGRVHTTYGQFCPVALGAEVFAERWTPLILRELLNGSHRFNDLHRGVPRISRALLAQRPASLQRTAFWNAAPAPSTTSPRPATYCVRSSTPWRLGLSLRRHGAARR